MIYYSKTDFHPLFNPHEEKLLLVSIMITRHIVFTTSHNFSFFILFFMCFSCDKKITPFNQVVFSSCALKINNASREVERIQMLIVRIRNDACTENLYRTRRRRRKKKISVYYYSEEYVLYVFNTNFKYHHSEKERLLS